MSMMQLLASDQPLTERLNPHIRHLSINQAIALEMELPDFLLENPDIDRSEPVIQICDDEKHLDDLAVETAEAELQDLADDWTDLPHRARLSGRFTVERVGELIDYIGAELSRASQIEVLSLWLDGSAPALVRAVRLADLTEADLAFLDGADGRQAPMRLRIAR